MKKTILSIILFTLIVIGVNAQGYKLEVNITGVRDSMLILAVHYGNDKYVRDTAYLDAKGQAVFTNKKPLDGGMYIVAMNGTQLFDFLLSDDKHQQFSMTTTKGDYTNTLRFTNSPENEEFANFNRYMSNRQKREEALKEMIIRNPDDKDTREKAKIEEENIQKEYREYVAKIATQFPNSLLLNLAKMLDKPSVPKFDIDESNPKRDSIFAMQYYLFSKNHFFDNYNFTDKRLLNTPVFIPSMDYYFEHVVVQQPDSIIAMVDKMLLQAKPNAEMTKFVAGQLFNKYAASKIMGMESIVVHLIDNYYLTGKINTQDTIFLSEIKQYAARNRSTLIGKRAPDLKMQSTNGQYESIHSTNAPYVLVYFYEPSCGICKHETPKIYNLYKKYRDKGLVVFAVYTQQNKEEWLEYVSQNGLDWINVWDPQNATDFRNKYSVYSVPQAFLLDKDKKIVGRKIDSEGLDLLLDNLLNKPKK